MFNQETATDRATWKKPETSIRHCLETELTDQTQLTVFALYPLCAGFISKKSIPF